MNRKILKTMFEIARSYVLAIIILIFVAGCTQIQLIANYDEKTDSAVTELQRAFETFFVELEDEIGTPQASYENHKQFYKSIRIDISAIKLRVAAQPKNEITLELINLLEQNVNILRDLHIGGIDSIDLVNVAKGDFNVALTNILKLELAKKRGKEGIK